MQNLNNIKPATDPIAILIEAPIPPRAENASPHELYVLVYVY
jgi:hypothetical protein